MQVCLQSLIKSKWDAGFDGYLGPPFHTVGRKKLSIFTAIDWIHEPMNTYFDK